MPNLEPEDNLKIAKEHLERVQAAWDTPTDWKDLCLYGFYCLEAAIKAASLHVGIPVQSTHPSKASAAQKLHKDHGLPDVEQLLIELNQARKAEAYGDVSRPDLEAEETAREIEKYVDAVEDLIQA